MTAGPIRTLVVEDSLTIRRHIAAALSAEPGFEVVGEAADGKAAIELCRRLRPDLVTMDMMLPVMSGLAATEYIMAYCPTPILIVSASTNRGELFRTYDALAAGAVDVLEKPGGNAGDPEWERRLVAAARVVSRVRVITHPRGRWAEAAPAAAPVPQVRPVALPVSGGYRLVAIGASTGGPAALVTLLGALPADFPLPVLVVLHMAEAFGTAMADWLDAQLRLEVRCVRDGEVLGAPGRNVLLMAPPGRHLEVCRGRLRLTDGPERHFCRPSVDVLFESLAREMGAATVGCLLTGMGRDGARGLLRIREAGGLTLAEDESTATVFGMPGEAVKLGAARHVLALPRLAAVLARAAVLHEDGEGSV